MSLLCCTGASLSCSMGTAPATLNALGPTVATRPGTLAATVADHVPMLHITPFGLCRSLANPAVAAATTAAAGTLTPMPCIPLTPAPWTPGSAKVRIAGQPALGDDGMLVCMWAGQIRVAAAGSTVELAG
ncbi:DUF4280 domain-containing protein [Rubrivivax albus]|uniref:DUF4280 domain-containing protein n=1 Tax=Rubrivivax albus TaxID=2499835 RepID=A0A3S2U061_9BURK|nr:DUF4280 domain-containing protein [Rubrivivax albus]RVT48932.1 DUF4280 domain-containing protein [Rubrivivax albus]